MSKIIPRHKAALRRSRLSQPVRLAVERGLIRKSHSIFDYGCGRGTDAHYLSRKGYNVVGHWDPYYFPQNSIVSADIVLLSFVLSTIEDIQERDRTLTHAYQLCQKRLIVSFLKDSHYQHQQFNDGYLTKRGTFEKCYSAQDCKEYLIAITGKIPQLINTGIYSIKSSNNEPISYSNENLEQLTNKINQLKSSNLPPNPKARIEKYRGGGGRKTYARWRWHNSYKHIGVWNSAAHEEAIESYNRQQSITKGELRLKHLINIKVPN